MLNKKITYSIYLIKRSFIENNKYLQGVEDCEYHKIAISGYNDAELYIKKTTSKKHDWSHLIPNLDWSQYKTSSLFALLLIKIDEDLFALTAGLGRYLLHPFSVENRFGFKVVLNSIDPETIHQLSKKTLSQNPKTSIEQVTKGVTLNQFGLDSFMDLVQRVRGKSKLETLGLSLDGEDALKISVAHELHEIPELLKKSLSTFESNEYKKYFPEIDNLSQVKDKQQVIFLTEYLENQLNHELEMFISGQGLSGDIWASIPEIVGDPDFESYTYKNAENALQYYDIELSDIWTEFYLKKDKTIKKKVTISSLKNNQLFIRKADGIIYPKWKAINCINAIIEVNGETFCFTENEWFRISDSYIARLDTKIANIPSLNLNFKNWPQQQSEKDFLNSRPLNHNYDYLILDRNNIIIEGQSPIEPCDVFTKDKLLIHLKRYGASSLLGHLFNQGFVSGDMLINSVQFKEEFNKKLNDDFRFDEFRPSDFTIAYVIGTKYKDKFQLPLFSKVILSKTYDALINKGFKVTLDLCQMTLL